MTLRTYLQVPFPEKDQAKALGARWDPLERKWFVQAEDLTPFRRWLPLDFFADAPAPPLVRENPAPYGTPAGASADVVLPGKGISLRELMGRVQSAIEAVFGQPLWVRVEIQQLRQSQGHWFLELVEHDAAGQLVASTSGTLWKSHLHIVEQFRQQTGVELAEGIKVLLAVQPKFNPRYGLKLDILGIDSAYTLGDMAARLHRIRETLKAEGVFLLNRRLPLPSDFRQVAVISPSNAASLGDFRAEADRLETLGACRFHYFEALFQGPAASAEIRQALKLALRLHDEQPLDAVIIIRGGGSAADLAWLNDEELARAVCRCPLPVITGIGHEPDNTILDEVAARRCDTPSKVAQLILTTLAGHVGELEGFWRDIRITAGEALARMAAACDQAWDQTQRLARRELDDAVLSLETAQQHIANGARQTLYHRQQQITLLRAQCHDSAGWRLQAATERVDSHWAALRERGGRQLAAAETACGHLIQVILALGPEKTLRRGYGYLRQNDRVITRQADIAPGSAFMIHLQDGVLPARRDP